MLMTHQTDPSQVKPGQWARFKCPENGCSYSFWRHWQPDAAASKFGESHCLLHGTYPGVVMLIVEVNDGPGGRMSEYRQYRRTQIAEMADWTPDFDMNGVSISAPDREAGSPKTGDKIARNPANHDDKWLVAAAYFAENFEALSGNA